MPWTLAAAQAHLVAAAMRDQRPPPADATGLPAVAALLGRVAPRPAEVPIVPASSVGRHRGAVWGDYTLEAVVGAGGMGEIYRARQRGVDRLVAIKVLHAAAHDDPELRARFAAEVQATARIASPHVVAVHASGIHDGHPWLAMELLEHGSLADALRAGRTFRPAEAVALALAAARGLEAAHGQHLIHRDIKPGNLLLTADGSVKLADFGLARLLDRQQLTRTGTVLGTPDYLSPEQGRGAACDARSDLYSLGVVFYELLTGRRPFVADTPAGLIFKHGYHEPELPTRLNPDVPQDVQAVCLACLQKDPERRFRDATALRVDLERVLAGLAPVSAVFAPGRLDTGAREALRGLLGWRRWRPLAAAGLAVAVLALAGGWWWWDGRKLELGALRQRIEPLGRVAAIPDTAVRDLDRLARLAGDDDPQVVAGRAKLTQVAAQAAILDRLAAAPLAGRDDLDRARAALAAVREAVGPDPRQTRWQAWIDGQEAGLTAWRNRVETLIARSDLPLAAQDELRQTIASLASRGALDPELSARAQRRLSQADSALTALRERLAALDAPRSLPPGIDADLAAYEALAGMQDAQARAWRTRLATVRTLLARLPAPGAPPPKPALVHDLAALLGPDDPQVAPWLATLAAIATLRPQLAAALDPATPIPADAAAGLARLAALAGAEDADVVRWRRKFADAAEAAAATAVWDAAWLLPADARPAAAELVARWRALEGDGAVDTAARRLAALIGPPAPAWAAATGADSSGSWADLVVDGVVQRLRWRPPGTGRIGSPPDEPGRDADEAPATVRLSRGQWIADSECTQALWAAVMGTWPARRRDPRLPVEQVRAEEAEECCRRLSARLGGATVRLPSEAEWELACRAGATDAWAGLEPAQVATAIIHAAPGIDSARPVGGRAANRLGLHDLLGNVWEWCADGEGPPPTGAIVVDPLRPPGPRRSIRGGSWGDPLATCRAASRAAAAADIRSAYLGFRFVIDG